jgi:hypothetical protein
MADYSLATFKAAGAGGHLHGRARPLRSTRAHQEADRGPHAKGVAFVDLPNSAKALRLDEMGSTRRGDSLEDMKVRPSTGSSASCSNDGDTQEVAKLVPSPRRVFVFDEAATQVSGTRGQQPA